MSVVRAGRIFRSSARSCGKKCICFWGERPSISAPGFVSRVWANFAMRRFRYADDWSEPRSRLFPHVPLIDEKWRLGKAHGAGLYFGGGGKLKRRIQREHATLFASVVRSPGGYPGRFSANMRNPLNIRLRGERRPFFRTLSFSRD